MNSEEELQEIGHTGGQVTFTVAVNAEGRQSYQVGWRHSRPTPAALFAVYAIPQGMAVGDIHLGGIGQPWNAAPIPGCYPVFISSDSTGMFGHQCPACSGYWRSKHKAVVCPYCATRIPERFRSLTDAQRRYVEQYCDKLTEALSSGQPGNYVIDMDSVADSAGKGAEKPTFYYAEERQQNHFTCGACGEISDVLGAYAYCSSCGTRNDLQELQKKIVAIRDRINAGGQNEACVKEAVGVFDSFAGQYAKQLQTRVPMTASRHVKLRRARFHNLQPARDLFLDFFDIDILRGVEDEDIAFGTKMFHRRHVYEHKGGEADEKYITDTGDAVRVKQALRETTESAHATCAFVLRLADNLHRGFHDIFPPQEGHIRDYESRRRRRQ